MTLTATTMMTMALVMVTENEKRKMRMKMLTLTLLVKTMQTKKNLLLLLLVSCCVLFEDWTVLSSVAYRYVENNLMRKKEPPSDRRLSLYRVKADDVCCAD